MNDTKPNRGTPGLWSHSMLETKLHKAWSEIDSKTEQLEDAQQARAALQITHDNLLNSLAAMLGCASTAEAVLAAAAIKQEVIDEAAKCFYGPDEMEPGSWGEQVARKLWSARTSK